MYTQAKSSPLNTTTPIKFVAGWLIAAASAKRRGDKRPDPEALDEKDALPRELTLKLHRWLLILFVGRRENTQVTAVQVVVVVSDVQVI